MHPENSLGVDESDEGQGQMQAGQNKSEMEQQRTHARMKLSRMMEGGRGRTSLERSWVEMERNRREEGQTANPRMGSKPVPSGRAELATGRQEQPGEERNK